MVILSLIVGGLLGTIWGILFSNRQLQSNNSNSSPWILASLSAFRYILLAAILIVLITKYKILLAWWLTGFLTSFWIVLIQKIQNKGKESKI